MNNNNCVRTENRAAEIVPRDEAIEFLQKPRAEWVDVVGRAVKAKIVRGRGAGGAVDLINLGMRNENDRLVAVMRVGMAPYGGAPAVAAVGRNLASYCAYLMRLSAIGIDTETLRQFVRSAIERLPKDLAERGREFRYLLSLDNPDEILIDGLGGILAHNRAVTGKVYVDAGALHAGMTTTRRHATRYITPEGEVMSIYRNGKNIAADMEKRGCRVIVEGQKNRFLFVLAPTGSPQYAAWRRALPSWVTEPVWGENNLGWVQPRMLTDLINLRKETPKYEPAFEIS